jgi:hypothetical protein
MMRKKNVGTTVIKGFALLVVFGMAYRAKSQDTAITYPNMAPIDQYLMDRDFCC